MITAMLSLAGRSDIIGFFDTPTPTPPPRLSCKFSDAWRGIVNPLVSKLTSIQQYIAFFVVAFFSFSFCGGGGGGGPYCC